MAQTPIARLKYQDTGCPDCGVREVTLPRSPPAIGDDFDWDVRDYDGVRMFMLEELAARFPMRTRWTAADVEVVLIELLASQLDKLSDMLDRVAAEQTLATARRPETVRRLLTLIGSEPLALAWRLRQPPFENETGALPPDDAIARFEQYWLDHPDKMDQARAAGPRAVRTQRRMVTREDYASGLEGPPRHPLVERAFAWSRWEGAWPLIRVAVIAVERRRLDQFVPYPPDLWRAIEDFHAEHDVPLPPLAAQPTLRAVLQPFVERRRMVGQPVELADAIEVGIVMALSIQVGGDHFRSDVRRAIQQALGVQAEGFFRPGRLRFGEDVWASDIVQALVALDGVDNVCINRFKRLGERFPNQATEGRIALQGIEVAVCDNDPAQPARGYYRLVLHGGRRG